MSAVELFHKVSGEGDTVVLAHAIGMDHRMWSDLAPRLATAHRVVALDLRGHGRSPVPARPYALEDMADDVVALLDRLGVERAHWVGLSMGGMIGMAFMIDHPARVARVVLANTTSSYGPEGRAMWQARAKAVSEGGLAAIKDMVMGRYFSDDFRERHADVVRRTGERFLETPAEGYLGCCDAIADLDFTNEIAHVHARTLVIAGERDAGTPPAMSRTIADRIPGAQFAIIPEAAHLSAVEKPAEFSRLVQGFLSAP